MTTTTPATLSTTSKGTINDYLMEYFLMEGYGNVVKEFGHESFSFPSTSSSSNHLLLATLESRELIQQHISNGLILESLEIIEKDYPDILLDPYLVFKLYQQYFIECLLQGNLLHALQYASSNILPLIIQNSALPPPITPASSLASPTSSQPQPPQPPRNLLSEVEQMMCLILFLNSNPDSLGEEIQIPLKYQTMFSLEQRYSLAIEINSIILQSKGYKNESKLVTVLKEMISSQNSLKRKVKVAFPQPELEF